MGRLGVVALSIGAISSLGFYLYDLVNVVPPLPDLQSRWWGPGDTGTDDPTIRPFHINVTQDQLEYLKTRLETVQLQQPLDGVNFEYGFNTYYLQKVIHFWLNDYDWRSRENYLNSFPQFTTQVDGLQIHFVHVKPKPSPKHKILPLLILHGWPGSVREFYEIIPMLTSLHPDREFVFEVIAPSLPGYGFSQATSKRGFSASQMSILMKDLMLKLGFEKFYIHGGNLGGLIAQHMATFFPNKILGLHSTRCVISTPKAQLKIVLGGLFPTWCGLTDHQYNYIYPISKYINNLLLETGYWHLQSTKPDTIGVALHDSPAGLAAYILEKFSTWSNLENRHLPDGGLTKYFRLTDLLDNVMVYWISNSIGTSIRMYGETFSAAEMALNLDRIPTKVATICAQFPPDLPFAILPKFILNDKFHNLIEIPEMPDGGHFAAMEQPKLLSENIYKSIDKMIQLTK